MCMQSEDKDVKCYIIKLTGYNGLHEIIRVTFCSANGFVWHLKCK